MKRSACPRASTLTCGRSRGPRTSPRAESRPEAPAKLRRGPDSRLRHSTASSVAGRAARAHVRRSRAQRKRVDTQRTRGIGAARANARSGGRATARRRRARAAATVKFSPSIAASARTRAPTCPGHSWQHHAGIESRFPSARSRPTGSAPSARSCGRRSARATLRRRAFERQHLRVAGAARAHFAFGAVGERQVAVERDGVIAERAAAARASPSRSQPAARRATATAAPTTSRRDRARVARRRSSRGPRRESRRAIRHRRGRAPGFRGRRPRTAPRYPPRHRRLHHLSSCTRPVRSSASSVPRERQRGTDGLRPAPARCRTRLVAS